MRHGSFFFMVVLTAVYLGFVLALIPIGADDLRMANVFSIDESDIVAQVWNLYATNFQAPPSFKYGGVFFFIPVVMLKVLSVFTGITEQHAIVAVRFLGAMSGVGCLWVLYGLGCMAFDPKVAAIAAFFLAVNDTFLRWAVEAHPDLPQLFFILCSLLFLCRYTRQATIKQIGWAACFAGLAFATKYAGVFLLPVLLGSVYFLHQNNGFGAWFRSRVLWVHGAVIMGGFLLVFVITNPSVLLYWHDFVASLQMEKETMSFGHRVRATSGALEWVWMLLRQIGWGHVLVGLAGFGIWVLRSCGQIAMDRKLLLAWVVVFFGYLILASNLKRDRHLLPILPVFLLFVGGGYLFLWDTMRQRLRQFPIWSVVILVLSWAQISASAALFDSKWHRISEKVEIEVGRWLAEVYPENTRILYDAYAYVPGKFSHVFRSVGMDYAEVNHFEPDVLIIRDAIVADFAHLDEANEARIGALPFKDRHYFYRYLQEGKLPAYRLRRDFGSVAVYERTVPKIRDEEDLDALWRHLLVQYVNQRRYGVLEAFWTTGFVHLQEGQIDMAKEDFARAQRASNFTKRIYSHGVWLLNVGPLREAQHALDAALLSAQQEPIAFQAGMREDLAYRFFQVERYDEMLKMAQGALSLRDNLPAASFEQAVAQLALGNEDQGLALFDQAIARFGNHKKGGELLEDMKTRKIASETATRLYAQYYGQ